MFIIECLPLTNTSYSDSLSYFSLKSFEPGSLVKVEVRKSQVPAIVTKSRSAPDNKSEIRSAPFALKKITSLSANAFLSQNFLDGVFESSNYFAVSNNGVLNHLLPAVIIQNPKFFQTKVRAFNKELKQKSEFQIFQSEQEDRFAHYKALVREEFARKKSVFICVSENQDIKRLQTELERGIEMYVCAFRNDMTKKEIAAEWKRTLDTVHPVVIIGTPNWVFIPRQDLGSLIVEGENKRGWRTLARPYIDLRHCVITIGKKMGLRVILGDSFLRTETLWQYKQERVREFESIKWRFDLPDNAVVVNMEKEKEWKVLSPELIALLEKNIKKGSRTFLYAARKGLAPTVICRDCGASVICQNCESPMILHKSKSGNIFRCHQCGATRATEELCRKCQSWKLAAFGTGIDRVVDELSELFPNAKILELHKDVATTHRQAEIIAENFYGSSGTVLVGTEMALPFLHRQVNLSAIVAIDSLFAIPDFRIREKIFRLILEMRNLSKDHFLLQTRNTEDSAVKLGIAGNLLDFYRQEITDRQALGYPPFSVFIKVTIRGTKNFVMKETESLRKIFLDWQPAIFSSIHEKKGAQAAVNAVLKVATPNWPDPNLLRLLHTLSPFYEIKVDPDNLL